MQKLLNLFSTVFLDYREVKYWMTSLNTIIELANIIIKLTNSKSKIINKGLPIDDPIRRKPDISKAKKELNWEPSIDLKDGLQETINYFKTQIK